MTEEEFQSLKNTWAKEPTDGKKEYCIGCYSKDDWVFIHEELKKDGSLEDNIPTSSVTVTDDKLNSDTRGVYLLTDTEAEDLRKHSRVQYVHINTAAYPGTYADNPDDIAFSEPLSPKQRYSSTVRHQRDVSGSYLTSSPPSSLLNRGGYQLLRHTKKIDSWYGQSDSTIIDSDTDQYGTGEDVDVIVCDTDMWFGHIEFQNPALISNIKQSNNSTAASTSAPINYIGGNVLRSGYSSSSTTGTCDLLDLVLDAPYYIDPAWFEADAGNRLITRWDGTKVPVESVARSWWSNSSQRSSEFASAGTITSSSISSYTRAGSNGSNTAYHTGSGSHGTPCASQTYGRQYGWAYNANKWFLNLYGTNSIGIENGFDIQKIFHQNKPVNPKYGTKDPTISSNSWGLRQSTLSSGYYYFREGVTGGSGTSYSTRPAFMANFYNGAGASRCNEYVDGHAAITAGDELIESGVIFVCASGNHNQKLVQSSHADYNNYYASSANTNYADAKTNSVYSLMNNTPTYNSINRPGFPQQIGVDRGTTPYTYKSIAIGALDDDNVGGNGAERKVSYSNMGNAVDCFASADDTLAASDDNTSTRYNRFDAYYTYNSSNSVESEDKRFNGTSSACPVTVGLIATKLQYNRSWTYVDIKNWLTNTVGNLSTTYFYTGTEATTATDSNWTDVNNLQGASPRIIYDARTKETITMTITGEDLKFTGDMTILNN
tara:strand:- start:1287 stop:3431 length:2145 start_codon:yes stop_codon:yes gene_type:complete